MRIKDAYIELKRKYDFSSIRDLNIVLFGVGRRGRLALKTMRSAGFNVVAFSDNNFLNFSSERVEGLPVIAPERIGDISDALVVITVTANLYHVIKQQLNELGYLNLTHMELMLLIHEKEFHEVYTEFLKDEKSRNVFENILLGHLSGEERYFKDIYEDSRYFAIPEFDQLLDHEVYVDCGAYDGDSVETYIMRKSGVFKKIYAFEPVSSSYLALKKRVQRLNAEKNFADDRIECLNYAVGETTAETYISTSLAPGENHVGAVGKGTETEITKVISLDDFFEGKEVIPTFIKADIEGEELHMIRGARKLIAGNKPKLGICVYHNDEDLFELPMELKRLNSDYKFALRHHWPQFCETVLYCW